MVTLRKNWTTVLDVLEKLQTRRCLPDFKRGGNSEAKWLRRCIKFTKLMVHFIIYSFRTVFHRFSKQNLLKQIEKQYISSVVG